jgi:hypothetical protein
MCRTIRDTVLIRYPANHIQKHWKFAEFLESGKFFQGILKHRHDKSYGENHGVGQKIKSPLLYRLSYASAMPS